MTAKKYRKTATTYARPLTEADYVAMNGIIQTLEGPAPFEVGDYLAHGGHDDYYPIKADLFAATKQLAEIQPKCGNFRYYNTTSTVRAEQEPSHFFVVLEDGTQLSGKPGDYLVHNDAGDGWIVDQAIFEDTYTEVEQE